MSELKIHNHTESSVRVALTDNVFEQVILLNDISESILLMLTEHQNIKGRILKLTVAEFLEQPVNTIIKTLILITDGASGNNPKLIETLSTFQNAVVLIKDTVLTQFPSIYFVSIPKSGTHLVFTLLSAMGYTSGVGMPFGLDKKWYPINGYNTHTRATKFFEHYPEDTIHGGRLHSFGSVPTLFLYRNPLDILISESEYYPKFGQTIFSTYFNNMSREQVINELLDGNLI